MSTSVVLASALGAASTRALGIVLLVPALGALGCSGSEPDGAANPREEPVSAEVSACISGHPAGEPFDVGQVDEGENAATPQALAAECRSAGGTGCDSSFISLEAARCIAQSDGFEPGLEPWSLALSYLTSYRRVAWEVQNVLVDNGPNDYSGKSRIIDAVNGRRLGETSWHVSP